jgi:hypothetical protein
VNKDNKDRSLSLEFDKIKLIKKWVWAKCSVESLTCHLLLKMLWMLRSGSWYFYIFFKSLRSG